MHRKIPSPKLSGWYTDNPRENLFCALKVVSCCIASCPFMKNIFERSVAQILPRRWRAGMEFNLMDATEKVGRWCISLSIVYLRIVLLPCIKNQQAEIFVGPSIHSFGYHGSIRRYPVTRFKRSAKSACKSDKLVTENHCSPDGNGENDKYTPHPPKFANTVDPPLKKPYQGCKNC